MPHTINGIGTSYVGKTNVHVEKGKCPHCGTVGDLSSYDTTYSVVFLFIPIMPLGRRRVINDCPRCRRHRRLSISNWNKQRIESVAEARAACEKAPDDIEAAGSAISTAMVFQDSDAIDEIMGLVGPAVRDSAEIQHLLGVAYDRFGRPDQAEAAFRNAMKTGGGPAANEMLAVNLLKQGRPDEAWDSLQHLLAGETSEKTPLLLMVAESYQSWGMHEEALAILDDVATAIPSAAKAPEWRKLRRLSEKHRSTGKKLRPTTIESLSAKAVKERSWAGKLPRVMQLLILLVVGLGYLVSAYVAGRSREVCLVNGLDREYRVSVSGIERKLQPHDRAFIELSEGAHTVRVLTPELGIPEQTVRLETPFFSRPFKDHTFVLNPDRCAVLLWEETRYTTGPADSDEDLPFELRVGDLLTHFTDVDYPFAEFPNTITMPSSKTTVSKTRVDLVRDLSLVQTVNVVLEFVDPHAAVEFVKRQVAYFPDSETHLHVLCQLLEPGQVILTLEPLLSRRPVLVQAHRIYQNCMERTQPEHDLLADYKSLLQNEPDNPDLQYLTGRLVQDPGQSEELYTRAIAADPPCAFAYHGLAFLRLSMGRFEEALAFSRKATELAPDRLACLALERSSLMALGEYDQLLQGIRESNKRDEEPTAPSEEEVLALICAGRSDEAWHLLEEALQNSDEDIDDDLLTLGEAFPALDAYVRGDIEGWIEAASDPESDEQPFHLAIHRGDLEQAHEALGTAPSDLADQYLILYVAALWAGETAKAEAWLAEGLETIEVEGKEIRTAAGWLLGDEAPETQRALDLSLQPGTKAAILTAMGLRFPRNRDAYFDLARQLNFDRRFPHLLLKGVIDAGTTTQPATAPAPAGVR